MVESGSRRASRPQRNKLKIEVVASQVKKALGHSQCSKRGKYE